VVQGIREDDTARNAERRHQANVCGVAAGEEERFGLPNPVRKLALELQVGGARSVDQARRP
jgi:hypothetical protein